MSQEIIKQVQDKMTKAIESLQRELATVRTGRANPAMLDRVMVDYYGSPTPINQVATVSVSEGRTLVIKPYDPSSIKGIEKAINDADLGMNPQNDGSVVRITVPALTEDTRKQYVKVASKMGEDAKVAIRNIRRDGNDAVKKAEDSEDAVKRAQDQIQKSTDEFIKKVDNVVKDKEQDIMSV